MLKELDQTIISLLSQDIPLVQRPFENLASKLGIEEKILISRLKAYKKSGRMRKFSAALNHHKIGFKHNAMVVWNVPDKLIDRAGSLMAAFPQISHCYQRKKAFGWGYNLYSMIHGRSEEECLNVVKDIYRKIGCQNYKVLFSLEEYKKTAAKY